MASTRTSSTPDVKAKRLEGPAAGFLYWPVDAPPVLVRQLRREAVVGVPENSDTIRTTHSRHELVTVAGLEMVLLAISALAVMVARAHSSGGLILWLVSAAALFIGVQSAFILWVSWAFFRRGLGNCEITQDGISIREDPGPRFIPFQDVARVGEVRTGVGDSRWLKIIPEPAAGLIIGRTFPLYLKDGECVRLGAVPTNMEREELRSLVLERVSNAQGQQDDSS